ncbi:tRNA (adenosine(37)-N6)-threonylcarbamoyltransferase complex dimerization subunit type 1 TsaB [Rubrimonas cliftonensis]|uniref:tRNA threonylcarbamoyl adenosine modification protein YeaZ n=1 Tax=Rubrimonas cliftonensis TaxID=89524 RepID=A0A1H4DY86_9RHOB|nr:tRNA (adenosine(37)-N6)-threonylcarbamoyltransferase complex dimerization subunit type 1 TsaB [Rubrimonas cliftonensis]SEA77547.1 tRNA threonylcarbamoyl adenosine modification protein YeaZ [Rubrimonas cliftonensis]
MTLILVLDTCDARCAAGVARDGAILVERAEAMRRGHAERLFALISEALAACGVAPADLAGVAVATGPGGFTGGRIGVAAARGLALGVGRPVVGVDWFAAMAFGVPGRVRVALPGGGATWAQEFESGRALGPPARWPPGLPGDAAEADVAATIDAAGRDAAGLAPLALAATAALKQGGARPRPLYLRPPDALAPAPSAAATVAPR